MAKKQMLFKTKGMNRDLSVSAFNPEFAFENRNLRLSTNESNTMLSWVNEKGTEEFTGEGAITIDVGTYNAQYESTNSVVGLPIGTAIIDHQLIIFTTNKGVDRIYKLKYSNTEKTALEGTLLFRGALHFDASHPLETLVSYESDSIQKVYWTDGLNQPRMINIKSDINPNDTTQFDFVPELELNEEITVQKVLAGNGTFAPGVIQYAFTYFRKNGQESNIFYTTPLYYISHRDRGASPDDKVENAFRITVENPDKKFDYLRIYSIQRTSINGTPIVKRIQDVSLKDAQASGREYENYVTSINEPQLWLQGEIIPKEEMSYHENKQPFGVEFGDVECYGTDQFEYFDADGCRVTVEDQDGCIWVTTNKVTYDGIFAYWIFATDTIASNNLLPLITEGEKNVLEVSYTDTGTSGDSVDPTELLYKGGEVVAPKTLEQKDNTLFLGNISIERQSVQNITYNNKTISDAISISSIDDNTPYTRTMYMTLSSDGSYKYANQLTAYKDSDKTKSVPCAGFKNGNKYRCGVQFQHRSGKWSEPIWKDDIKVEGFPSINNEGNILSVPVLKGVISNDNAEGILSALVAAGYRKIRPVVVFPKLQDKMVICQGVINPTMYTENHRNAYNEPNYPEGIGDLYAQSSWFFRPRISGVSNSRYTRNDGAVSPKGEGMLDYMCQDGTYHITDPIIFDASISHDDCTDMNITCARQVEIQGEFKDNNRFKIDSNSSSAIYTFHSPDIIFDDQLSVSDWENLKGYKVSDAEFKNTLSDIEIQTETPSIGNSTSGFIKKSLNESNSFGIVSGLFYDDYAVEDKVDEKEIQINTDEHSSFKWLVYPWNKTGSLNNDINRPSDKGVRSAVLKKKKISNLRYAETSTYSFNTGSVEFNESPQLFSSDQVSILKFGNSKVYQGNIDTVLTPDYADGMYHVFDGSEFGSENVNTPFNSNNWWKTYSLKQDTESFGGHYKWNSDQSRWEQKETALGNVYLDLVLKKEIVRMKYKSTPHLVLNGNGQSINWQDYCLPIIDIYRKDEPANIFGGTTQDALRENTWIPCGEPVSIVTSSKAPKTSVEFEYSYGDTYFQRWDCLKTYAFTPEDENQIIEIGSFMLETYKNIDGRYDRNRGQQNNLNASPQNFNLLNPVYSQVDNFFSYKILDEDTYKNKSYANQVTWSKSKSSGADVDLWTNVTLASILELDGDKGEINKLIRFNNYLFAFQDSGIAQILYNDNVQISSTDGVPIEIANSGKVQGKNYKSDSIGCSNKWSMASTPAGIYFMDNINKEIFLFNGQVNNISLTKGFSSWCKKAIITSESKWNPFAFDDFVAYYDKKNQEILFINNKEALAYSEKFNVFTSFYDYARIPYLCNLDDTGIWLNPIMTSGTGDITCTLHKHQAGEYCKFFGHNYSYNMTLIGNPEPQLDKIFTNIEFRACVDGEGETSNNKFTPYIPFSNLETWDEYQRGIANMTYSRNSTKHHTLDNNADLKRRFRIWRCDIPRDNASTRDGRDAELGITRFDKHPNDRMRNPWIYIKLQRDSAPEGEWLLRTEIHDVVMTYFE